MSVHLKIHILLYSTCIPYSAVWCVFITLPYYLAFHLHYHLRRIQHVFWNSGGRNLYSIYFLSIKHIIDTKYLFTDGIHYVGLGVQKSGYQEQKNSFLISSKYVMCGKNVVKYIIIQITQQSVWERKQNRKDGRGKGEKGWWGERKGKRKEYFVCRCWRGWRGQLPYTEEASEMKADGRAFAFSSWPQNPC